MAVERSPSGSSLIDVLDRVLDKGIVIDAWVRVSLVGIDLVTIEARIEYAIRIQPPNGNVELRGTGAGEQYLPIGLQK